MSNNRKPVPVMVTKPGRVSKVREFKSLTAAAKWIQKKFDVEMPTARANICNASLGRESRENNVSRTTAYGYIWTRLKG